MIKYISLFAGIGGFELGLNCAATKLNTNIKCVFASEFDPLSKAKDMNKQPARIIYHKNLKRWPEGDITKINAADIPDHDILCGGFPCQDVSIAGKRKGLCGARTGLFFDIIRILREKQPRIVLLENVKGLLSSNNGWDFARILIELENIGYECEWQVLNTAAFLPQNRERVFIIGHLTKPGRNRSKIFPIGESSSMADEEEPTVYCLDANYYKGPAHQSRTMILSDSGQGRKDQIRNETIPPLRANTGAGHNNIICHSTLPRSSKSNTGGIGHLQRDDGLSYCLDAANNIAIERPNPENIKCLTGGGHSGGHHSDMTIIQSGRRIRRLTPVECERLQGFPQLESYININIHNNTICVDLQKSYVDVETRNHKQQKHAGNVEKSEVKENVSYVEQNLNTNNPPINKPAQKNVVINCVEGTVEIHNQKKSYSFANYVESQNSYLQYIKTEDFAHLLAGINTTLKNAIHFGKEVLHQNEQYLIQVKNGKLFVKLYGKEMMQFANDAKIDLTTLKKHLKYITSNHLNLENVDYNWIISYCYVINAITGCIQTKTQINNSLNLEIKSMFGYTFGISDTSRYKCLGNAVSVPVIEFIAEHIITTA